MSNPSCGSLSISATVLHQGGRLPSGILLLLVGEQRRVVQVEPATAGCLVKQCKSVRYLVEQQTFQTLLQAQLEIFLHAKQDGQLSMIGQATVPLQQLLQFKAVDVAVLDANGTAALRVSLSCTHHIPWASFRKQKVQPGHPRQAEQPSSCRPKGGRFSRRQLTSPFSSASSGPLQDEELETASSSASAMSAADDEMPSSPAAVKAQGQPSLSTQLSFNAVCNRAIQACRLSWAERWPAAMCAWRNSAAGAAGVPSPTSPC